MRNHGTIHSRAFLFVVFRIVSLAVLCRYVLSNKSLFGSYSSSSSGLSSPWILNFGPIYLLRGGGNSENVEETTQQQQERQISEYETVAENDSRIALLESQRPQEDNRVEELGNTVNVPETQDSDEDSFEPTEIDLTPFPAPPNNNMESQAHETPSYANDTLALAMAGSSLWDMEHDAEVQVFQSDEEVGISNDHNNDIALGDVKNRIRANVTRQSDLTLPGRHVHIVSTAALPWMTGTAVNPLLRAANLHRRLMTINENQLPVSTQLTSNSTSSALSSWVTLVIPWLELPEDQEEVYHRVFASTEEQEAYIRTWLRNEADIPDAADNLNIVFYPARYHSQLRSVFAMGDIIDQLPEPQRNNLDVCILEEPEHLNWYRAPGHGWTKQYKFVLGIVHTNYKEYASSQLHGVFSAPAISVMSTAMVRAYCHKVIKLSDVLQTFAPEKETTSNVHGVRRDFLQSTIIKSANSTDSHRTKKSDRQIYFIGKLLWAKGLDLMLSMEDYYKQVTGEYFPIDIYGSGPDQKEITRAFHGIRKIGEAGTDIQSRGSDDGEEETEVTDSEEDAPDKSLGRKIVTKVFAWYNRRSIFQKPRRRVSAANTTTKQPRTWEYSYQELLRSLETIPVRAKQSFGKIQSNAKESLEQFTDYADEMLLIQPYRLLSSPSSSSTNYTGSLRNLPGKAKARLEKLSEDLPKSFYEFRRQPIPSTFPGRIDHAALKESHSIFVNPSVSEVLCTTTAEALAMGKFAIVPVHPSNTFFLRFPNCLAYRNKMEFVANLRWALTHDPEPLTPELARAFTWEAATDRLISAAAITPQEALERERLGMSRLDSRIAWFHNELGKGVKGDVIRKVLGAGPVSDQVKYEEQRNPQHPQNRKIKRKRRRRFPRARRTSDRSLTVSEDAAIGDLDTDDEDEIHSGLLKSRKFRKSSFVQAIRAAAANGLTYSDQ